MGKMVTEHLFLASPLSQTPSNRFGQLSGTLGYSYYWSTTDWLPLLVRSDEVVGVLPPASPSSRRTAASTASTPSPWSNYFASSASALPP